MGSPRFSQSSAAPDYPDMTCLSHQSEAKAFGARLFRRVSRSFPVEVDIDDDFVFFRGCSMRGRFHATARTKVIDTIMPHADDRSVLV